VRLLPLALAAASVAAAAWVGLGLGGGSSKSVFNIKPDTKLHTPGARAGVVVSLQAGWGS